MNSTINREIAAQFIIIAAVCVGGWMVFVQPRADELREIENTMAAQTSDALSVDQQEIEHLAGRVSRIGRLLRGVHETSRLAAEPSELYAMVMDLAREHGVDLSSLDPGELRGDGSDVVRGRRVEASIRGQYEDVAAFIDAVSSAPGYVRITAVRVDPVQQDDAALVNARLMLSVYAFEVPDHLVTQRGGEHAER